MSATAAGPAICLPGELQPTARPQGSRCKQAVGMAGPNGLLVSANEPLPSHNPPAARVGILFCPQMVTRSYHCPSSCHALCHPHTILYVHSSCPSPKPSPKLLPQCHPPPHLPCYPMCHSLEPMWLSCCLKRAGTSHLEENCKYIKINKYMKKRHFEDNHCSTVDHLIHVLEFQLLHL